MRLIPWWSEKADRVMDGRTWVREAGCGVSRSKKWSMEDQDGREGGSKDGGRVEVRHVNWCGVVRKALPLGVCESHRV